MSADARQAAIERELEISGAVEVQSLAKSLAVSPITIRRDLTELERRGVARRVYGGAVAVTAPEHVRPAVTRKTVAARADVGMTGLVVPSSRYYYMGFLEGVKEAAAAARVRVALGVSTYSAEQERFQIRRLLERGVTGLLVTPSDIPDRDPETYEMLREVDVPVVLMERGGGDEFSMFDSVRSDHAFGARLAFQRLAENGHRAVALVAAEETATAGWLKAGFREKLTLFDEARSEILTIPSAPEYAPELLTRSDEILDWFAERGVTGALVHSDVAASVLAQRARERGIEVPDQLEIIAYDDEVAALADPPLSAIAPSKREVGRLALELVLERSGQDPDEVIPRWLKVPPRLVIR